MAIKSANVMARVEPGLKAEAERIMGQLGLSASTVINTLYRQIVLCRGIPYSLTIPREIPTRDSMTKEEFDEMMSVGLAQAKAGQGMDVEEAFKKIRESI